MRLLAHFTTLIQRSKKVVSYWCENTRKSFSCLLPVLILSMFLLLVIPANYLLVSIDTGFPCHLRTHVQECFVVSQFCDELWIVFLFVA